MFCFLYLFLFGIRLLLFPRLALGLALDGREGEGLFGGGDDDNDDTPSKRHSKLIFASRLINPYV